MLQVVKLSLRSFPPSTSPERFQIFSVKTVIDPVVKRRAHVISTNLEIAYVKKILIILVFISPLVNLPHIFSHFLSVPQESAKFFSVSQNSLFHLSSPNSPLKEMDSG